MNKNTITTLGLVGLFIIGMISGAALAIALDLKRSSFFPSSSTPFNYAEHIKNHLKTELNLNVDQQNKINPLIDQKAENLAAIRKDMVEKIRASVDATNAEILKELNPEQQEK